MGGGYKNLNLSDFASIFGATCPKYEIQNIEEDTLNIYKEAYKIFKERNPSSKGTLFLNIGRNILELLNFDGIDMFKFGKIIGQLEAKYESTGN